MHDIALLLLHFDYLSFALPLGASYFAKSRMSLVHCNGIMRNIFVSFIRNVRIHIELKKLINMRAKVQIFSKECLLGI